MKKILIFLSVVLFTACSSDDDKVNITLAGHEKVRSYFTGDAKLAFSVLGMQDVYPDLKYNYDIYKIRYNTSYAGQQVVASALVGIPDTDDPVAMLSFQHGTIAANKEAPTENLSAHAPFFSIASSGYIFVVPDYIGFGSSTEVFHPYYIAEPMGKSIADAIIAAKELADITGADFNGDLFLAGYSEGGYATMAAHKYIEENSRADIELIASAPASGGYDVKAMQEHFFNVDTYDQPFYMAYVVLAYNRYYGWDIPLSTYFKEPYASKLEGLFNGQNSGSQINANLTTTVEDLLQPEMLSDFETAEKYAHLKEALEENSLTQWSPEASIFMYHGTADVTVPYTNSLVSHDALVKDAEDQERIQLILLEGKNHSAGVLPYVKDVYYKFRKLK